MLDVTTFIKIILKKRGMSQADLLRKMEAKGIKGVHKEHLSEALNGKMFPIMAERIEIALDLPKDTLVKMVNSSRKRKVKD